MPRKNRFAPPGYWLHITQRGNDPQRVFLSDADREYFLDLFAARSQERAGRVSAYTLMSNHFHLVAIGDQADAISLFMMDLGGLYASNAVHRHTGHLWQSRFYSAVLDTAHWATALRYVELNPVRARMVGPAEVVIRPQSPRTCAHAHLARHRTVPAPQAPLADARRMLAASMPGPVLDPILDIPQPQEINRAKVDVTKNAAQCANFERPACMDRHRCA